MTRNPFNPRCTCLPILRAGQPPQHGAACAHADIGVRIHARRVQAEAVVACLTLDEGLVIAQEQPDGGGLTYAPRDLIESAIERFARRE